MSAEEIKQYAIKNYLSDYFPGESGNDFIFLIEKCGETQRYRLYCQSNTPYPHSALLYLTNDGQLTYAWINQPNYPDCANKAEKLYNELDKTALETRFTEEFRHPGCNCCLKGIFMSHEAVLYKGKPLLMITMRIDANPSVTDWVGETGYPHSTYFDNRYSVFYALD